MTRRNFHPRRDTRVSGVSAFLCNSKEIESNKGEIKRQLFRVSFRPDFHLISRTQLTDVKAIHVDLLALFPIFHVSLSPLSSRPSFEVSHCMHRHAILAFAIFILAREFVVFTFNFIFTFFLFLNLRKNKAN